MRKITRIKRSIRAISPVISVLLMIAIAVVASLVAYAWVMGYMNFQTGKMGQSVQIQSTAFNQAGDLVVYVQNVGQGTVQMNFPSNTVFVNDVPRDIRNDGVNPSTMLDDNIIAVPEGKTVALTINYQYLAADEPLRIKIVTLSGTTAQGAGPTPTPAPTTPAETFTLTLTHSGSGTIVANPAKTEYTPGESVQLQANAGSGWTFTSWGGALSGSTNPTTITMDSDKTVTATFTEVVEPPEKYTLTTSVVGSGTVNPSGGSYDADTPVQITATPAQGWRFDHWSGASSSSDNPVTIVMNGPKSITATFTQNPSQQFTVTFGQSGLDSSVGTATVLTVNGVPKALADLPYSVTVNVGDSVTYSYVATISGGAGKQFVSTGVTGPATPVTSAATVTSNYQTQYQVVFSQSGVDTDFSGTVMTINTADYNRDGASVWINAGDECTFSYATPLVVTANSKQYVLTGANATSSLTINEATWVIGSYKTQYWVEFAVNPSTPIAGGTTNTTGYYDQGENRVVATANSGYGFASWTGSITVTPNNQATSVATVNGPGTITANFDQVPVEPRYSATITPTSASQGTYTTFTLRITKATSSSVPIGNVQITVPTDFTSVSYWYTSWYRWTGSASGNVITIYATGNSYRLDSNGDYIEVIFRATTPSSAGNYQFATVVRENTDGTGSGPGTISGSVPSVGIYTLDFVDTNADNHSPSNLGTHSDFNREQAGPDSNYGRLRETDSGVRRLDQEVQFTGITNYQSVTELHIYTGDLSSEDIQVSYWDGTDWVGLVSDLNSYALNIIPVTLTSNTFELRFTDGSQTSDSNRSEWYIDYIALASY